MLNNILNLNNFGIYVFQLIFLRENHNLSAQTRFLTEIE